MKYNSKRFVSRSTFLRIVELWPTERLADLALISINDTPDHLKEVRDAIDAEHGIENVSLLSLEFPDVDHCALNQETANQIVSFVHANRHRSFLVHCLMGVSRSAAVAKFINDHLHRDDPQFETYDLYNKRVYNDLQAVVGESLAAHYAQIEERDRHDPV